VFVIVYGYYYINDGKASIYTPQHDSWRPSFRQRRDDGGKASTKMTVAAKHQLDKHRAATKAPARNVQ
jgi:hypothetical protein